MKSDDVKSGLMLAGVGVAVYLVWKGYSATKAAGGAIGQAAQTVGGWVNPASDQNLIYQGVNAVGGWVAGDKSWTLGGGLYDLTHDASGNFYNSVNATLAAREDARRVEAMAGQDWSGKLANPLDPVPAGYVVDNYGFYKKAITSGGGGNFTGTGATGSW